MCKRICWTLGRRQCDRTIVTRRFALQLRYWPRSVQLLKFVRGAFPTWDSGQKALSSVEQLMPIRPASPTGNGGPLPPHANPGKWALACPNLAGYLTDPTWPDGAPRVASRLFITPVNGNWEYTLKEPGTGLLLVVVVEDPDQGLPALEALLSCPNPPWRADPWARSVKTKKK